MILPTYAWALIVAIILETVATTALKASDQFSKPLPTAISLCGYLGAIYLLSYTMKYLPVGVVYAIWSGLGIVFVACIAWVLYGQKLDLPAIIGMVLIISGIVTINLFSKTGH